MALDPNTMDALFALYRARDFGALAARVRDLLGTHADELVLHSLLGAACLELEDYDGAAASYERALVLKPDFAKVHNSLGLVYLNQGRLDAAHECFATAVRHAPGLASAHFNLGLVLERACRRREAAAHYALAVRHDARHVAAHTALGLASWELGALDAALDSFDAALAIRADHAPAHRGRLAFLEQANRHDELRAAVTRARAALGEHTLVALYEGILAELDADLVRARDALESLEIDAADALGAHDERQRLARLARIADRLDDADAALDYAARANALSERLDADAGVGKQMFLEFVSRRHRLFADGAPPRRRAAVTSASEPAPVFVVGFPRSGTTLLDAMLRGHPDLGVAEESGAVAAMVNAYAGPDDAGLEASTDLSDEALAALRATYWQALARDGLPAEGTRIVDRFGLNMIYAGEIRRVFPDARFVLLVRDPADCVLSCYLQAFAASSANASFYTLNDAANLYDRVFDLWACYEQTLGLEAHMLRYEDLVADVEGSLRALLEDLGLPWHPDVLASEQTARARPLIRTASYHQVTQPVSAEAVGRWRRYREALEPVLPVLAPWMERFGYAG